MIDDDQKKGLRTKLKEKKEAFHVKKNKQGKVNNSKLYLLFNCNFKDN